jgi:hypothetical protein
MKNYIKKIFKNNKTFYCVIVIFNGDKYLAEVKDLYSDARVMLRHYQKYPPESTYSLVKENNYSWNYWLK